MSPTRLCLRLSVCLYEADKLNESFCYLGVLAAGFQTFGQGPKFEILGQGSDMNQRECS